MNLITSAYPTQFIRKKGSPN